MNKLLLVLLLIYIGLYCYGQTANNRVDGNPGFTANANIKTPINRNESVASDYISLYQKYISSIRGQECPMYPSCSNFGLKTFGEQKFATAFAITSDRLLRCGHDHKNYSLTLRPDGFKLLDYPAYDNPPSELYYSRNSYYFAFSDNISDDSTYLFIKKLMNNQYFQEALLEISRVEFRADTFNVELFTNKIICLRATGGFEKALFEYETRCPAEHRQNAELVFQIALIEYKLQNFDKAFVYTASASEISYEPFTKSRILLLNGLLYANKSEWDSSMLSYQSLSDFEAYKSISETNYKLSEKAFHFKNKSPGLAAAISVIPGAGYAYTGHVQTAISALLINGLLAFATYTNFKRENYGMGALTGVFNLSFYIGNIYGAAKSAKRFNEQYKKSIINKLEFNTNF